MEDECKVQNVLLVAIRSGHKNMVNLLLRENSSLIDTVDNAESSVIHAAHVSLVESLN